MGLSLTMMNSSPNHGRGFTLIELLTVLGIIAVLAMILLPVLSRAKAYAGQIQCLNGQRQWYLAFNYYTDDNNGFIPREGYDPLGEVSRNNWSQIIGVKLPDNTRDSDDIWYNALPRPYLHRPPASYYAPAANRRAFYQAGSMFHCPSAQVPSVAYRANYQFALFSTAMNSQLIQYGEGPTIRFSRIEQHPNYSKIVIFLEGRLEGEKKVHPAQEDTQLGQPAAMANRFSARHRGKGNLVFADGHAETLPGRKVVQTDDSSPLRGGPILPPVNVVWDLY
jgi:prepilin-type N-terminal cleavage/methylation domain-containing protein/prepilin-type processing-associated H-X9-DG protein